MFVYNGALPPGHTQETAQACVSRPDVSHFSLSLSLSLSTTPPSLEEPTKCVVDGQTPFTNETCYSALSFRKMAYVSDFHSLDIGKP